MKTKPVVLFIFNRPYLVPLVMARVREYKPSRVYLVADGPRVSREKESDLCAVTRAVALREIDWPCEVFRVFSESNLGCKRRIVSGLNTVFSMEEEAIILEDDTLPTAGFFTFCETMLDEYRDSRIIFSISGTQCFKFIFNSPSPVVSDFSHIWGWATWRRSWVKYDGDLKSFSEEDLKKSFVVKLKSRRHVEHWLNLAKRLIAGEIDTWDYQLQISMWMSNMICIYPPVNLVENVGFSVDATHTLTRNIFSNLKTHVLPSAFKGVPARSSVHEWLFKNVFHNPPLPIKVLTRVLVILKINW